MRRFCHTGFAKKFESNRKMTLFWKNSHFSSRTLLFHRNTDIFGMDWRKRHDNAAISQLQGTTVRCVLQGDHSEQECRRSSCFVQEVCQGDQCRKHDLCRIVVPTDFGRVSPGCNFILGARKTCYRLELGPGASLAVTTSLSERCNTALLFYGMLRLTNRQVIEHGYSDSLLPTDCSIGAVELSFGGSC